MNLLRHAKLAMVFFFPALAACTGHESPTAEEGPVTQKTTQALTGFDFENGDIASDVVIPTVVGAVLQGISGGDATIILYTTSTTVTSWFDAIAPYSATMVGVFSRIPRRPASEGANNVNRNVAIMHASYHTLKATNPRYLSTWRAMLTSKGLNPDDESTDLTTAVGIGNYAGKAVVAGRANDGFNRDGNAGGRKYNLRPYDDTTEYEPVNSPFELSDPSRWQPKVVTNGSGIFQIQKFVTPQYGNTKAFSFDDKREFRVSRPVNSDYRRNPEAYRRQADEVLEASANLTDEQKMIAELFNHKFQSLGRAGDHVRRARGMTLEQFIQYDFVLQIASFDGGVAAWSEKARYDAVRPFSAIRHLYGKKKLRAWGGPGKGTVNDITGNEWESYLPVADHPEYPSGSSCFCAAHAQASRRWLGTDEFGWSVPRARGSSTIEPGITPANDIVLSFPTFTDFARDCGQSRLWGGVHFQSAIDASVPICTEIGNRAYEFAIKHVTGNVD